MRIFAAALAPLLAIPGCGGVGGIDEAQFSYDACAENNAYTFLGSVVPASAVDFLELRHRYSLDPSIEPIILETIGTLCTGASDPQACMDAYAALPVESEFATVGLDVTRYQDLAYSRGDAVGQIGTRASLDTFLGPLDAPGDAALVGVLGGHQLHCTSGDEVGDHAEGYVLYTRTGGGCGENDDIEHHVVLVRADGTTDVLESELIERGDPGCAVGRLPDGLCRRPTGRGASPLGAFLADVAHLEAAAVPAFAQLAGELALHRAPASLVRGALRGRDDEVRHARLMSHVARRRGGRPERPRVTPTALRGLEAVAADNAIEGCVRETYGALVAHAQARRARDPELRRTFASIAHDETRHAALSWNIHRWAGTQLSPAGRVRLLRRRATAVERLRDELTAGLSPQVHALAGLPEPAEARALFDRLEAALRTSA